MVRSECELFFFFSSRRRHTRWNCDWSSDVCSSDLARPIRRSAQDQSHRRLGAALSGGESTGARRSRGSDIKERHKGATMDLKKLSLLLLLTPLFAAGPDGFNLWKSAELK